MVPGTGIEPVRGVKPRRILSPLCLPISPPGQMMREERKSQGAHYTHAPFYIGVCSTDIVVPRTRIERVAYPLGVVQLNKQHQGFH